MSKKRYCVIKLSGYPQRRENKDSYLSSPHGHRFESYIFPSILITTIHGKIHGMYHSGNIARSGKFEGVLNFWVKDLTKKVGLHTATFHHHMFFFTSSGVFEHFSRCACIFGALFCLV